jgi:hypothetical protein
MESDVDDKLATLDRWIQRDIMRRFDRGVDVLDGTGCCLCHSHPTKDEQGVYRFRKSCTLEEPRPCQIDHFWNNRESMLRAIGKQTSTVPTPIREAAKEVIAGKPPRGQRCWVHLSDAVIACESPPGSELSTTNLKDFQPLANAIGEGRTARNPFKP